ncbi:MAG: PEP-CTERM sorting domain-containing protein, partial [Proteobacteria bacterium]|nr:PEP-CTERM sorting domain-containing protein [Pseudomonadota bacterium]
LSVAVHELFHVLGFGLSEAWREFVELGSFDGPASAAVFGGPVPLHSDQEHWADGTIFGSELALLAPFLPAGERLLPTDLDWAGLQDGGWELVPEPSTAACVLAGLAILGARRRPRP